MTEERTPGDTETEERKTDENEDGDELESKAYQTLETYFTTGEWLSTSFTEFKENLDNYINSISEQYNSISDSNSVSVSDLNQLEEVVRRAEDHIANTVPKYYQTGNLSSIFDERRKRRAKVLDEMKDYANYNETDKISELLKYYAVQYNQFTNKTNLPSNAVTWREYQINAAHPDIQPGCCNRKPRNSKISSAYNKLSFIYSPPNQEGIYGNEEYRENRDKLDPLPLSSSSILLVGGAVDTHHSIHLRDWGVGPIDAYKKNASPSQAKSDYEDILNTDETNHEGRQKLSGIGINSDKIAWKNKNNKWIYGYLFHTKNYLCIVFCSNTFWDDKNLSISWIS